MKKKVIQLIIGAIIFVICFSPWAFLSKEISDSIWEGIKDGRFAFFALGIESSFFSFFFSSFIIFVFLDLKEKNHEKLN